MATREQQILELIRQDPMLPQQVIAERLGISRSAVAGHIMNLTGKGLIKGRGYVLSDAPFVTVIGGANIDIHGRSAGKLLNRDSNPGTVLTSAGGVARNIAENLVRLGVDCRLISAIGQDHHGQMLLRFCQDAGINVQYVHEISTAQTSSYLAVLDETGDLRVAINDMGIVDQLTPARLDLQRAMLEQSSLLVIDCNLPAATLGWLANNFASRPIFVDTVSATKALRLKPYLHAIHTLKANTMEVAALVGQKAHTQTDLRAIANLLHAEGVQRVFITRGENGVFYSADDAHGIAKPTSGKRSIESTSGAGDAFLAGISYAWLAGWDLQQSLRFALTAADITLSSPATNNPALSLAAVGRAMEKQHAG
ncbi:MAG: PfkB family carbohydrate kinase [Proteobacteria bacterium]|nr:PfkB family carbohydrate kinase [Pseudomonadota bacterium]